MITGTTHLLFYSANLAFIVTHLYGWLLKWYYRPKAYLEHFHELFPAQRSVGVIYLLQLFEIPYLLQIGDPDALLFVNAFALLFFSIQMLVMCELYFFPEHRHPAKDYWVFSPVVILLAPLFLQAVDIITLPAGWQLWAFIIVTAVFTVFFWRNIAMALRLGRIIRQVNESTYADSEDFPVRFAYYIRWVPTLVLVLLAINFYANDPWVKFVRDLIFIGANVTFCIYTLNPWRKVFTPSEENVMESDSSSDTNESANAATHFLEDERFAELSRQLQELLEQEKIFTESHITIDTLVPRLGINSKYLTEVIRRSGYSSFYDMICQHRVRHAISLISHHPNQRLSDIAEQCGFSSSSSMTKAFQSQGKPSPSTFRK